MASHRVSIHKRSETRGFTMIEVLTVLGILGVIAGIVMYVDLNSYRGSAFRAEQSALGVALQTARADALNNIDEDRHGVAINLAGCSGYTIFEGNSSSTANHSKDICIKASYGVNFSPTSPTEVIFDRLSGDAITYAGAPFDGDITLIDPNRGMTVAISINHEGKISW